MSLSQPFWVFIDKPTKRAKLHRAECGACKGGRGVHGHQAESEYWWKGFSTRLGAWEYVRREAGKFQGSASVCKLCNP
jgi:hypothetical protein